MKHFGAVSAPSPSHIMAIAAIGRELQKRGHQFTVFQVPETKAWVEAEGISFFPLGHLGEHALSEHLQEMGQQRGISTTTVQSGLKHLSRSASFLCEQLPEVLRKARIDCLLVDQMEPGAATVAEALDVSYVTICNGVPIVEEPGVPPWFLPWQYHDARWARWRNQLAFQVRNFAIRPLHQVLNRYRHQWGLRSYHKPDDSLSRLAQLTQLVPEFDLPRRELPACFHYVGPFRYQRKQDVDFPYERLDGRRLVYASLGTILDGSTGLWQTIAESCAGLDVQLVLSLGGRGRAEDYQHLPGKPIVVTYAPQRNLLCRASLVITPAGLNTTLEALSEGVPMVAIPTLNDQFGVAARIAYCGGGEIISLSKCRTEVLRQAVSRVLSERRFREQAAALQAAIQRTSGTVTAAEIIEQAATTREPVLANRQAYD